MMRRRAGTPVSVLVYAVLILGLLIALAPTPGTVSIHATDGKRERVEQSIAREEARARADLGARRNTGIAVERARRQRAEALAAAEAARQGR